MSELTKKEAARLLGRLSVLVAMQDELEAIGASVLRKARNVEEIARVRLELERGGVRDLTVARHLRGDLGDSADATLRATS